MRLRLLFLTLCILAFTPSAHAQDVLSPNANPEHSGVALGLGFAPDPLPIAGILAGGSLDLGSLNMGADCRGYVTAQPDYRINITYPFKFLRLIFVADSLLNDVAMIIRSPGGTYRCSNDSFAVTNPSLDYRDLELGEYNLWFASIAPNASPQGTLYVTLSETISPSSTGLVMPFEGPVITPTPAGIVLPTLLPGTYLDQQASPVMGTVTLEHGFLPDPYWVVVVGGGALSVPPHDAVDAASVQQAQCGGYTSSAPHLRLNWRGISTRLRLFFVPSVPAGADTSLAVYSPQGWVCNRSFSPGLLDPQVEFINPPEGVYNIWVTSETLPNNLISGVLYITEKQYYPTYVPAIANQSVDLIEGLDAAAAPEQGSAELPADFVPDPLLVPLNAGGSLDIATLNPGLNPLNHCEGFVDSGADFAFNLLTPLSYLRLFFLAADFTGDATMIVRAPDGRWYCNDDSYDLVHPTISIIGAPSGLYQVWLGSYGVAASIPGTLHITQTDATPQQPQGTMRIGLPAG